MICFFILAVTSFTVFASEKSASAKNTLNDEKRESIVDKINETLNEYYVFPRVAEDMAKLLTKKLKKGEYGHLRDLQKFTGRLTEDMRSISKDLHLAVRPYRASPKKEREHEPKIIRERELARARKNNFGFHRVEILDGNVGYIDLRGFYDAGDGGGTAVAAMNLVAYCDTLIIDLRTNSGGQPSMIQLICSYFFKEPKHLTSFYIRKGDITNQFWTHAHVEGPRMVDTPVYILVSGGTFSAAEGFAYTLKHHKRATIVGEKTRGGAHPQKSHEFPEESISIRVPYGKAVNPITKANWEGKGVAPDIPAPAKMALHAAHHEAVKKLMEEEADEKVKHGLTMIMEELEVKKHPVVLDEDTLLSYAGNYSRGVKAVLKNGSLNILGYILVPMGNDKFMIQNGDEQIQFVRDASDKITKLLVLFRNGRKVPFDRKK